MTTTEITTGMKTIVFSIEETIGCVFEDGSDTRKTTTRYESYRFSENWEVGEIREAVEVELYSNQDYSNQVRISHIVIDDAGLNSAINADNWSA
jgi:hypothetical protein